jgi:hypothetical protein
MPDPILKHGELLLPGYRRWARAQSCQHCRRSSPSDPHHYPTRGHSGVVFDLRISSLCRNCHLRAAGGTIRADGQRLGPIPTALQELYVYESWLLFVERGPIGEVIASMMLITDWRVRRGEAVPL